LNTEHFKPCYPRGNLKWWQRWGNEFGLELVPSREPIEMLVVEKMK
jgi:hypothetical protein